MARSCQVCRGHRRCPYPRSAKALAAWALVVLGPLHASGQDAPGQDPPGTQLRAVMLSVDAIDDGALAGERAHHPNAVVIDLAEVEHPDFERARSRIRRAGLATWYWFEVGHDPELARDHPEWLHRPHKLHFYGEPVFIDGWVSINNRGVFEHQLERAAAEAQRAGLAGVEGVLVNDVLGAPEGCGCGNALCRLWDNSEGDKIARGRGVTAFADDPIAPRLFAERLSERLDGLAVIPVITEECEAGITVAGVEDPETTLGYGRMSCRQPCALRAYGRLAGALAPLPAVGLLTLYRTFARDAPAYGPEAAWVGGVIERYLGHDPEQQVVAVLEGWDVTPAQETAQVGQALAAGASGFVIVRPPLDQTWRVRPVRARGKRS